MSNYYKLLFTVKEKDLVSVEMELWFFLDVSQQANSAEHCVDLELWKPPLQMILFSFLFAMPISVLAEQSGPPETVIEVTEKSSCTRTLVDREGTDLRHPVALRSTCDECSCIFRSSWRGEFSQPEWGIITALVNTARASWMIGILSASHDERFHRTPGRHTRKATECYHSFSSQQGFLTGVNSIGRYWQEEVDKQYALGRQDGLVGKDACCWGWCSEFNY